MIVTFTINGGRVSARVLGERTVFGKPVYDVELVTNCIQTERVPGVVHGAGTRTWIFTDQVLPTGMVQ
jgi:hypothetical protein